MLVADIGTWWETATAWLEANPEATAALAAWEREHVTGSGEFGTSDWPGWAASPAGPSPLARGPD